MKYIDADKIRTEIKRLKAENNCGTDEFIAAKDIAYDKVFDFLEILEEPVTDCNDLEEAKEKSARQYYVDGGYSPFPNTEMASHIAGFKAGAEWGADHLRDTAKKISEDLALTIADIEKLHTFLYAVKNNKHGAFTFTRLTDEQYKEVLRRFNKTKEQ